MSIDYKLSFRKFDTNKMNDFNVTIIIGKRGNGKSFLTKDILYNNKNNFTDGLVISPTEKNNKTYEGIFPQLYIHDDYSPTIINNLFDRQDTLIDKNYDRQKNGKKMLDLHTILIMDDCGFNSKAFRTKEIKEIFFNMRHKKASFYLILQFCLTLGPELRGNVDYIFLLADNSHSNRKRLYDHYCSQFSSFKLFNNVFTSMTENYGCMVIDNTSKSAKLEDCVFWYRAKDNGKFRIGNKNFWKYSLKYYDENHTKKAYNQPKDMKRDHDNIIISCKE